MGCDRSVGGRGSSMVELYSPGVQKLYNNFDTTPQDLLLFFHNVGWDQILVDEKGDGTKKTLLQLIEDRSVAAIAKLADTINNFATFAKGEIDDERYDGMLARFAQQLEDASVFSTNIVGYYNELIK